ncbi:ABM domain-containing protein [Pleurotus pulmonarius]
MSTFITSWLGFVTTDEYRANPQSMNDELQSLGKDAGCTRVYHGVQHEDPEFGYLIPIWPSSESRQAFRESQRNTEVQTVVLASKVGTIGEAMGVDFTSNPAPVFEAGIVEVLMVELKDGKTAADLAPYLDEMTSMRGHGVVDGTWGTSDKSDGQLVVVIGWDSIEAHKAFVAAGATESLKTIMGNILGMATLKVNHVRLHHVAS